VWQNKHLRTCSEPIFGRVIFHPSSYGNRPGRSAHQAISKAVNCSIRANQRHWVVGYATCQMLSTRWTYDLICASSGRQSTDARVGLLETVSCRRRDGWTPGYEATKRWQARKRRHSSVTDCERLSDASISSSKKPGCHRIARYAD